MEKNYQYGRFGTDSSAPGFLWAITAIKPTITTILRSRSGIISGNSPYGNGLGNYAGCPVLGSPFYHRKLRPPIMITENSMANVDFVMSDGKIP